MSSKKKNSSQTGKLKKVHSGKKSTRDLGQQKSPVSASLPEIPPKANEDVPPSAAPPTPNSESDDNETTLSFQVPQIPEEKHSISADEDNETTLSFQAPKIPSEQSNTPLSQEQASSSPTEEKSEISSSNNDELPKNTELTNDESDATVSFPVPELTQTENETPEAKAELSPEQQEQTAETPQMEVSSSTESPAEQEDAQPSEETTPPAQAEAVSTTEESQETTPSETESTQPEAVSENAEEPIAEEESGTTSPPTEPLPKLSELAPLPLPQAQEEAEAEAIDDQETEANVSTQRLPPLPPMLTEQESNEETQRINFSTIIDQPQEGAPISKGEATSLLSQDIPATPVVSNLQDYATIPETPLPDLSHLPTSTLEEEKPEASFETREVEVAAPEQVEKAPERPVAELVAAGAQHSTLAMPPRGTPAYDRWRRHRKIVMRHLTRKYHKADRKSNQKRITTIINTIGSIFLLLMVLFVVTAGTTGIIAYKFYSDTQAQFNNRIVNLRTLLPHDNLKMYDSNGEMIAQIVSDGVHTYIPYDQISPNVVNATVSTEDKNFWNNEGYDLNRIIQQVINNTVTGHNTGGASTVTQQLIKMLVVGDEENYIRKLQEVSLTPLINDLYTKQDIMEMYLNTAFFGHQAYGVEAAATIYYDLHPKDGKSAASQMDIAQSAVLAGLLTNPSGLDPHVNREGALHRTETVLGLMLDNKYITQEQHDAAVAEIYKDDFFKKTTFPNRAPHFFDYVLRQLMDRFHLERNELARSDMTIYTTLDLSLQDKVEKIAQEQIAAIQDTNNIHNSAEVMLDTKTSAIRVLLGSLDYSKDDPQMQGAYDMASLGMRPPGSSIKPFVYLAAFEKGASPGQSIADVPTNFPNPGGTPDPYAPKNYTLDNYGHMTLRCALQNSLNVPAIKVLREVGLDNAKKMVQRLGVNRMQEGDWTLASVLGTMDLNLLEHTGAYATIANGGKHIAPYAIDKVVFANSKQEYVRTEDEGTQVVSPQLAYMMTNVLSDNEDRLPDFGVCNVLELYSNSQGDCYSGNKGAVRPAAAKTGTTQDFRDNWTMGYTTDYVMGVWAGNSDNSPMAPDTNGVTGAAPIWHNSLLAAEEGKPINNFQDPGGLVRSTMTNPDGVRSTDLFLADHANQYLAKSQFDSVAGGFKVPSKPFCPSYQYTRGNSGDNKGAW